MSESSGPPTNNVGSGNIAGIGVGPQGEPAFKKRIKSILRRKNPITESEDTFAGHKIFPVDPEYFHRARLGKKKYARWIKYVGNDDTGQNIKAYGYAKPKAAIIVQHNATGQMMYLRYPQKS